MTGQKKKRKNKTERVAKTSEKGKRTTMKHRGKDRKPQEALN